MNKSKQNAGLNAYQALRKCKYANYLHTRSPTCPVCQKPMRLIENTYEPLFQCTQHGSDRTLWQLKLMRLSEFEPEEFVFTAVQPRLGLIAQMSSTHADAQKL